MGFRWAWGITTVKVRQKDYLPRTLASLKAAGFEHPKGEMPYLFVDGCSHEEAIRCEGLFHLPVVARRQLIRTHGNWVLALMELYIRHPTAHRYALFQDDIIACKGLREYLERGPYPEKGYQNLITYPLNQELAPAREGWYVSNQRGLGAQGLVFSQEAAEVLLSSRALVERPKDVSRGTKYIDGGIVDAMRKAGWKEHCHNPSLIQHVGLISSMGNGRQPDAPSWRGETWDAMNLIR